MRDVNETKLEAITQLKKGFAGENIAKRQTLTGVTDGAVMQLLDGSVSPSTVDPSVFADLEAEDGDPVPIETEVEDPTPVDIDSHLPTTFTKESIDQLTDEELYELINPFSTLDGTV